jgi:hypothetical protein
MDWGDLFRRMFMHSTRWRVSNDDRDEMKRAIRELKREDARKAAASTDRKTK